VWVDYQEGRVIEMVDEMVMIVGLKVRLGCRG